MTMVLDGPRDSIAGIRDGSYGSAALATGGLLRFGKFVVPLNRACGACRCFGAGTLVLTASGLKAIEDIKAGDLVIARDETTGETLIQPVVETYVNLHRDVFELIFASKTGDTQSLIVTLEHPFHTQDDAWKPAGELKIGEQVQAKDGWLTLQSMRDVPNDVTTYNFMVAEHHNYFVGEQRLWVHNCCGAINDLLKPNGNFIGVVSRGATPEVRTVPSLEFSNLQKQLLNDAKEAGQYAGGKGTWYALQGGGRVGVRISEKSGVTLDIDIPGYPKGFKVHQE